MSEAMSGSLGSRLNHQPQPLKFGTSGRRGELIHLTQLEIYLNVLAEIEYLQSRPSAQGGLAKGDRFFFAHDLRPSATHFIPEAGGRGEIAQAVEQAIRDAGLRPVNLGILPTPALTYHALSQNCGSIMVTGSHIPFDRNGYKTNSAKGELLKSDEEPINRQVEAIRARLYAQPLAESPFNESGMFKEGHRELSPVDDAGRRAFLNRYLDFFAPGCLAGCRLLVYQHSAAGRDLLVEVLEKLGAEVVAAGRSETFVPIDTENVDENLLSAIQNLVNETSARRGPVRAVVSTDGDSDRPLVLGVDAQGRARFYGGDLLGMVVAEYLRADAVVVPISCNDAIDQGPLRDRLEPKTRIGSPYVIEGMKKALAKGRHCVCGWEANGGFLTGSDVRLDARVLTALPTRDAFLPILCVLLAARERQCSLETVFAQLPRRFSKAALLRRMPRVVSQKILQRFSPPDNRLREILFQGAEIITLDQEFKPVAQTEETARRIDALRVSLEGLFHEGLGFGEIAKINYTDGLRLLFANGDVAHVRPSGNADELRIYAVAGTRERAEEIARLGVAEPDGILRQMEKAVAFVQTAPDDATL